MHAKYQALKIEIEGILTAQSEQIEQWQREVEEKQAMIAHLKQQHDKLQLLLQSEADTAELQDAARAAASARGPVVVNRVCEVATPKLRSRQASRDNTLSPCSEPCQFPHASGADTRFGSLSHTAGTERA